MSPRIFMRKYIPSDRTMATRKPDAHLYLLYEDTRMRYPLLSFSCTLLVTEEPGSAIAAHSLVLLDPRRLVGQCKYLPF